MPEKGRDRKILQTLAESLPEKVLLELLPEIEPETVRQLLGRLAKVACSTDYPQQQALFQNNTSLKAEEAVCSLYTDGASRGNPGESGAGAVLLDNEGVEIATRSQYLGQCTNNVAEYKALVAGLELSEQYGCKELSICLDSELIVRQVQGTYKVKNAQLKPLFEKVCSHLEMLEKWNIRHVPRAENARADQLANKGIDRK